MLTPIGSTVLWFAILTLAAWWAAGSAFRLPGGLPRALGAAVLGWVWTTLGTLGLGLSGQLNRAALMAWAGAGLAVAAVLRVVWRPSEEPPNHNKTQWEAPATLALGLVLWAVVAIGVPSWLTPVSPTSDGPIYHLYFAARWWKAHRVFLIPTPFGETATPYFPHNGEIWFTTLMTLWGGDRLAKVGQAPFLVMAAASTFAIARRLGIGVPAAAIGVAWFITALPMISLSFEGDVDTIAVAGYLTCVYFLLRYALGDDGLPALVLGGLAAGAAWGTKATGTVFIPPLLALGAIAVLRRQLPPRTKLLHLAVLASSTILSMGYWYARNFWLTGNPLYPLRISLLGHALPGWYDRSAMRYSQFYIAPTLLPALGDTLLIVFDPRFAFVWAAALLGAWAIGRPRPMAGWIWGIALLAIVDIALYWLLIPYRTEKRFLVPAIGLAAVPLAALLDRGKWLRWLAAGMLAMHLTTPLSWPYVPMGVRRPWGLSGASVSSPAGLVRVPLTLDDFQKVLTADYEGIFIIAMLSIGAGALVAASLWSRVIRSPSRRRWGLAALATIVPIATIAVMTWAALGMQAVFPLQEPLNRAWVRLDQLAGPAGARVAYAGTNRAYYLMGHHLRNDVRYINIDNQNNWLPHDYHRQAMAQGHPAWPDPRPGWDRLQPDYDAWLANLAEARINLLFVTRALPQDGLFNLADREGFPIERGWADAHPEAFTQAYGALEGDPNARIYRVHIPRNESRQRTNTIEK